MVWILLRNKMTDQVPFGVCQPARMAHAAVPWDRSSFGHSKVRQISQYTCMNDQWFIFDNKRDHCSRKLAWKSRTLLSRPCTVMGTDDYCKYMQIR